MLYRSLALAVVAMVLAGVAGCPKADKDKDPKVQSTGGGTQKAPVPGDPSAPVVPKGKAE